MRQAKPALRGWYRNGSGFQYRQHRNGGTSRYVSIFSCLALPLAYFVAYLLRSAQCSVYGVSIELAPVAVGDFFSALFPLFLLLGPMRVVAKHLFREKRFSLIVGSITLCAVYVMYEGRHALWSWAGLLIPFFLSMLFLLLVAIDSVCIVKRDSSESKKPARSRMIKMRVLDTLACVCLGSLVCFYLDYDIPFLLLCMFASCFYYFVDTGEASSAKVHDNVLEEPIGNLKSWMPAALFTLALLSLLVFGVGYTSAMLRIDYPLLTVCQNEFDATEDEGVQEWCVLMLRSDDVAICIPAHRGDGGVYEASLAHDGFVRLINTSSTPCVLVKDGCRLSRTTLRS